MITCFKITNGFTLVDHVILFCDLRTQHCCETVLATYIPVQGITTI